MKRDGGLVRVLVLAASAAGCSILTGLVALYMHGRSLPPSDLAYGMSFGEILQDRVVQIVWGQWVAVAAAVGFALAAWLLRDVKLGAAIPTVCAVTVCSAALTFVLLPGGVAVLACQPAALAGGVATMLWFRGMARAEI